MLQNLQIPHWDTRQSQGGGGAGGAPSPFSISAIDTPRSLAEDHDAPAGLHVFSSDHFRMFHYKIRSCPRVRSHDWTECPYAHPAEKARRRDPCKYHYSGGACPEFRKGHCRKGDSCEFAHGVFECWLHPSRYRTQLCKDGTSCRRRVCFFAHTPDQLRVLAPSSAESNASSHVSSPTSVLNYSSCSYLSESPPSSPGETRYGVVPFNTACGVRELVTSMRNVQLDEVGSGSAHTGCVFGSPRGPSVRPGFLRVPHEEEPVMERVESGRDIRARLYAKLSKENSINGRNEVGFSAPIPDIGWVSELVK